MRAYCVILALILGGCANTGVLPTTPEKSGVFTTPYQKLAGCAFIETEKLVGPGVAKIDLPTEKTSKVLLNSAGINFWTLTFTEKSPRTTEVVFTVGRNMWGSDAGGADRVWNAVEACSLR